MFNAPRIAIAGILTGLVAMGGLALSVFRTAITHASDTGLPGVFLTGEVKSAPGEALGGVEVSAKAEGHTITTTVLTDGSGKYYFPALPGGKYRVWAQEVGYGTGRAEVELQQKVQDQDFVLSKIDDFTPQLRGDQWLAALPEDTPQHRKMKDVFRYNCVECHGTDFILQNKFDEQGWTKIITTMSRITSTGIRDVDHAPAPFIQYYKTQLASYLAEMRGPGPSPMHFTVPPPPTGEALKAVFREYDVPPDFHGGYGVPASDGSDWSLGTSSRLNGNGGIHDSQIDFDGNIWFTYTEPSMDRSVGKIDARTGEVTNYIVPGGPDGTAEATHGVTVGPDGKIYFDASPTMYPGSRGGPGSLVRIDPQTGKMDIYSPPEGQPGVGGQLFVNQAGDVCSTDRASGALVFHSAAQTFTPLHADPFTETEGDNFSYGAAFDRDGNCWWTQYYVDAVSVLNAKTGKVTHINFPKVASLSDGLLDADERKLYASGVIQGQQPGAQGTKRMYADRNGDSVWVGDYWGNNLAEINTHTLKVTYHEIPLPNSQPYAVVIDTNHKVWTNLQQADRIVEIDPETGHWTVYPPTPTMGDGSPHIGISEHSGHKQFSLAYNRVSKVGVMEVRTDEDVQSLKNEIQSLEKP